MPLRFIKRPYAKLDATQLKGRANRLRWEERKAERQGAKQAEAVRALSKRPLALAPQTQSRSAALMRGSMLCSRGTLAPLHILSLRCLRSIASQQQEARARKKKAQRAEGAVAEDGGGERASGGAVTGDNTAVKKRKREAAHGGDAAALSARNGHKKSAKANKAERSKELRAASGDGDTAPPVSKTIRKAIKKGVGESRLQAFAKLKGKKKKSRKSPHAVEPDL